MSTARPWYYIKHNKNNYFKWKGIGEIQREATNILQQNDDEILQFHKKRNTLTHQIFGVEHALKREMRRMHDFFIAILYLWI